MKKTVNILGASGSIGTQTVEVVKDLGYSVRAVSVGKNIDAARRIIGELMPEVCAVADELQGRILKKEYSGSGVTVIYGSDAASRAACYDADICVNAISGFAGLLPTISCLSHTERLAIANKETLVAAGDIVMSAAKEHGVEIIPVDSEHSAIFQCLEGGKKNVKRLILTCSGGAFFGKSAEQIQNARLSDALLHPTWNMGGKITVDCATLMNKGLEVIEAMHLFGVSPDMISVVIHRESIIHSMVEYDDNAVIAQLGVPDMRLPIRYALTYPERTGSLSAPLDLVKTGTLSFFEPDRKTFPSLDLAYSCARRGGLYPCMLNAANEAAVGLFVDGKIAFGSIYEICRQTLDVCEKSFPDSLEGVISCHKKTLETANAVAKDHFII